MPTRPSEHDPETLARWSQRRASLGARLREVRLSRGLTQESLALESGLSRNQLIAFEWGRSSLAVERLFDLADALGVPIHELLTEPSSEPKRQINRGGRRRKSAQ